MEGQSMQNKVWNEYDLVFIKGNRCPNIKLDI